MVVCVPVYSEECDIYGVTIDVRHIDLVLFCDDGSGGVNGEIAGGQWALMGYERTLVNGLSSLRAVRSL